MSLTRSQSGSGTKAQLWLGRIRGRPAFKPLVCSCTRGCSTLTHLKLHRVGPRGSASEVAAQTGLCGSTTPTRVNLDAGRNGALSRRCVQRRRCLAAHCRCSVEARASNGVERPLSGASASTASRLSPVIQSHEFGCVQTANSEKASRTASRSDLLPDNRRRHFRARKIEESWKPPAGRNSLRAQ